MGGNNYEFLLGVVQKLRHAQNDPRLSPLPHIVMQSHLFCHWNCTDLHVMIFSIGTGSFFAVPVPVLGTGS